MVHVIFVGVLLLLLMCARVDPLPFFSYGRDKLINLVVGVYIYIFYIPIIRTPYFSGGMTCQGFVSTCQGFVSSTAEFVDHPQASSLR